jgi:hypothetical protein
VKRQLRKFRFRRFTVNVPVSVVTKWEATPIDEFCKILESVSAAYSSLNDSWKRTRSEPIQKAIRWQLERKAVPGEGILQYHDRVTNPNSKDRVLWLLQFQRFRAWNHSPISDLFTQAVMIAALDGDEIFFRKLGRRLEEKPVPYKPTVTLSDLSQILLEHWAVKDGLCLCWFSDTALKNLLALTNRFHTADAVRKARKRLGLAKLTRPLILSVRREGDQLVCA